jgi:hypothetical protein
MAGRVTTKDYAHEHPSSYSMSSTFTPLQHASIDDAPNSRKEWSGIETDRCEACGYTIYSTFPLRVWYRTTSANSLCFYVRARNGCLNYTDPDTSLRPPHTSPHPLAYVS